MAQPLSMIGFTALALFAATMPAPMAFAQSGRGDAAINPQCATMGKPRQCTCALETGGIVEPGGKRWRYYNVSQYTACMVQHKWM